MNFSRKIVYLWCPDNEFFLRVNNNGRLFADLPSLDSDQESLFELIEFEGGRTALRSVKYNQFLSRATSYPRFHFEADNPNVEIKDLGPHQHFSVEDEYLLSFGSIKKPFYLYVREDRQVFPDPDNKSKIKIIEKTWYEENGIESLKTEALTAEQKALAAVEKLRINTEHLARRANESSSSTNASNSNSSLTKKDQLSRIKNEKKAKYNSTSSLYIKDTISRPDINELTWCMSIRLRKIMIEDSEDDEPITLQIFDERIYPILQYSFPPNWGEVPMEDIIYRFINPIFRTVNLSPESGILSLAYIERLKEFTGLTLVGPNWRRVCLSCLILASKVWEDLAVWNVDFQPVSRMITTKDLNEMEKYLLSYLQYNVTLKSSMYAKYFFELRSLSELDPSKFPIKPMDEQQLQNLEARSARSESKVRQDITRHTQTVGNEKKPTSGSRVVLS